MYFYFTSIIFLFLFLTVELLSISDFTVFVVASIKSSIKKVPFESIFLESPSDIELMPPSFISFSNLAFSSRSSRMSLSVGLSLTTACVLIDLALSAVIKTKCQIFVYDSFTRIKFLFIQLV